MSQEMSQTMAAHEPLASSTNTNTSSLGRWLSIEFSSGGVGGSSSNATGGTTAAAGTSSTKEIVDQYPVVDMADVMFNSGSSSSNSMDFLFPASMEDKLRDSGNKKN